MKTPNIKPFVWGMVVGSVLLLMVIFSTGLVMTSSSAKLKAQIIAKDAVLSRLAPIAVAQFMQDPNGEERLKEMKKLRILQRGDYVKEQGWATMPGEKEPDSQVAYECARRIVELEM
jgi:hypothetical protein